MFLNRAAGAVLFGLMLGLSGPVGPVGAQTLRIVGEEATSVLKVPMNRAVVVESERPFAELSVANPDIADIATLSDRTMYVLGKAPGRTTLTILDAEGRLIQSVEVRVSPDLAELKEKLREILPGEPIEVRSAAGGIVLSGTVSSGQVVERAMELASLYVGKPEFVKNLMQVGGTQQVMLKVRFAEMQRTVRKALSGSLGVGSSSGTGVGGLGGPGMGAPGLGGLLDQVPNLPGSVTTSPLGTFGVGLTMGRVELGLLLEALETKRLVRTLAEPTLSALSGQPARFLAGGEYPVPVVDGSSITVEYKPFGVELAFTPAVVSKDVINLRIDAAVSAIDNNVTVSNGGFAISGFRKQKATTSVEMHSGQSFAIAGLTKDDFTDSANQVPWLGDVPILGALFRSSEFQREQTELVILITPYLVSPNSEALTASPIDQIRPPTERELFLLGRTGARANATGPMADAARQNFVGSYGYVME